MPSNSWEEIKRLAADFQRVQLVESSSKLSERNCIEIINKLIDMEMINLYHSMDGKEFITHKHVEKEIYDELYVHDGRINIVKLQSLLNIDISHIEVKANEIVKKDPNLVLILGQIISKDYMNKISEEINEMLQDKGNISISELTNLYELPADFIQQIVKPRVGTIIKGNYDGNMLYTHNYVNTQKAKLAGILEASIKPLRFSQIIKEYNLDVGIIFEIYDDLINTGQIKGSLFGGRQALSAVFVPEFFTKAQKQYVESFLKQNGYIDYASLKKIGISEPDSYVKSLFASQDIEYLTSICFARYYLENIEQEIEEHLNRVGFCDLSQILPSSLNSKDINTLTMSFESKLKSNPMESLVVAETYLVAKSFLKMVNKKFETKMEEKSGDDLKKPNYVLAIKNESAVVGGSSSSSQSALANVGTKSKAGKSKKSAHVAAPTNDEETTLEIQFMDRANLIKELKLIIADANDDLIEALIEHLLKPLNVQYFELLKSKIEKGLISTGKSSGSGANNSDDSTNGLAAAVSKPPTIKDIQEKVKTFLLNARIFEKALKLFTDIKVQETISKHLIKTIFSEIVNDMVQFIAYEQLQLFRTNQETLNHESRTKSIQKFKEPFRQKFTELNQALTNKTSSEVIDLIEKVAVDTLEFSLKKFDQKKEKEILVQMRENSKQNLETEKDPATILHLTLTLLFYQLNGLILNSPGRCVPNILDHLRSNILNETYTKLIHFQNVIIENATTTTTSNKSKSNEIESASTTSVAGAEEGESTQIDKDEINEIRSIGLNAKAHLLNKTNV